MNAIKAHYVATMRYNEFDVNPSKEKLVNRLASRLAWQTAMSSEHRTRLSDRDVYRECVNFCQNMTQWHGTNNDEGYGARAKPMVEDVKNAVVEELQNRGFYTQLFTRENQKGSIECRIPTALLNRWFMNKDVSNAAYPEAVDIAVEEQTFNSDYYLMNGSKVLFLENGRPAQHTLPKLVQGEDGNWRICDRPIKNTPDDAIFKLEKFAREQDGRCWTEYALKLVPGHPMDVINTLK
ncbi:hypothetical protein [Aeromonas phage SW69-9]|uniref:Uncharacterized protein n=2 Tax=Biquartavirus 44RR2 TaxID=115987 RepID=Q6U9B0_9CAUD|nr:hypothetical protein ST44RRORF192c [Aeromonas phage 44RR2.8t]AAQ81510.1 hypothetical protein 44RRORF192c [Aeromonas phage 44RR2.8t]APU00664.1 hypothetical protein [Aeromonas phage 44RR2.8t.2]APU01993.1 hypothetical protein [Aeromonas phage L9-6]APU02492.1 hypothetical protein [Aeromonas phage SW69-9]